MKDGKLQRAIDADEWTDEARQLARARVVWLMARMTDDELRHVVIATEDTAARYKP